MDSVPKIIIISIFLFIQFISEELSLSVVEGIHLSPLILTNVIETPGSGSA
jgi:hypothetical protein